MTTPDPEPPRLTPRQSSELLEGLEGLKRDARRGSGAPWLPLALFGAITTVSAPLVAVFGMEALGPTWIVGGVVGFAIIAPYYRRREERVGIAGRRSQILAAAIVVFLACFAIAAIGQATGNRWGPLLGPPLIDLLAYLGFGWFLRSRAVAVAIMPGVAATALLFGLGASSPVVLLAFGVGQLLPGAWLWAEEARA